MGFITALAFTFVDRQRMRDCDGERGEIVKWQYGERRLKDTHSRILCFQTLLDTRPDCHLLKSLEAIFYFFFYFLLYSELNIGVFNYYILYRFIMYLKNQRHP